MDSKSSTEDTTDDDASRVSGSQMHAFPGDGGHDAVKQWEEDLKELNRFREAEKKRIKRKPKKTVKGPSYKRLSLIPAKSQLNIERLYRIGQMTRVILWKNVKYFSEIYRNDCLKVTLPKLGLSTERDRATYSDHVIFEIDQKLTICRNNAIYKLKKLFNEENKGGKFFRGYTCDMYQKTLLLLILHAANRDRCTSRICYVG